MKKYKKELDYESEDLYEEEGDKINLSEILTMIHRRFKLIFAITVVFTGLGIGFAMTRVAIYKAATTLIVSSGNYYNAKNLDSIEVSLNQKLATTYTAVAKSPSVLNAIIKKLDLDMDTKQLSGNIDISSVENTELIKITATDKDPVMAMRIADEAGIEFTKKIKEVMTFENIRVVESAELPDQPESRKRALIITVAFLLGAVAGTFLIILVEKLHSQLRRTKDIEKIMMVNILGHIPVYEMAGKMVNEMQRKLFFKDNNENQVSESFRLLRTNLRFVNKKENKMIIVTSTIPKEGKSLVASNYAMSEAMIGKKVLIIDCDIRRPRAHSSFGIGFEKGLADLLVGEATLEEVIIKGVEQNLDLLPAKHFKGNVTDMFLNKNIEIYLKELRAMYDLIILDTAPLTVATDAVLLAEHGDGILYVVGYDMVTKKKLEHAKKLIDRSGEYIYGVVLNKIDKNEYSHDEYGYNNDNYREYNDNMKE
ncbi:MAG: polysaccharide biosynthesis tyrosine autokinase [Fusobacteriaceae bacterium]